MKISKEVRIGILVTLSILIFFIGYDFLKNATFFSNERIYYCFYGDVEGLQNSAAVQIRGLNVGKVSAMQLVDGRGVRVTLTIIKNVDIPEGTIASLESQDLLGTKAIRLDAGKGPGLLKSGAELISNKEGGMVDNVTAELTPRLKELKVTITSLDTTLAGINAIVGMQNQQTITAAINSIKITADNLAALSGALKEESGQIKDIVHNANSITANLARSNDTITRLLSHVNNIATHLDNAPIEKTVTNLQDAANQLSAVMEKINTGQGTLGLLVNDKDVYNNLKTSLGTLNKLMADINAHPSRYININIIGGKRKD
jgi:phospholipid/cholesterol/gamma-HCH transport system substrate-binding protein